VHTRFGHSGALLAFLLCLACGSSTSPTSPTPVPSGGGQANLSISPPGGAVVGVTVVGFTASGPSGTSFQWDFGDGSSGAGQTVTHVYTAENTFNVTLTIGNGTTGQGTIVVKGLSGTWADVENPNLFQWTLVQSGSSLNGNDAASQTSVQGTATSPRHLLLQDGNVSLNGRVEEGLDSIDVTWSSPAGPQEARLIRQ
jgi:PKD repeat protein